MASKRASGSRVLSLGLIHGAKQDHHSGVPLDAPIERCEPNTKRETHQRSGSQPCSARASKGSSIMRRYHTSICHTSLGPEGLDRHAAGLRIPHPHRGAQRRGSPCDMGRIDLAAALWTVPAGRMKTRVKHAVPLSPRAIAILREARAVYPESDLVFPGTKPGLPLSDMTLTPRCFAMPTSTARPRRTASGRVSRLVRVKRRRKVD